MRYVLRKARKGKALPVDVMAKRLGISASFYYKIERGSRNPTMELARRISTLLGLGLEELFFTHEMDDVSMTTTSTGSA